MKKLVLFTTTFVLATAIIFASCTPSDNNDPTSNYTCHCLITSGGSTYPVDQVYTGVTLSYATSTCETQENTYNTGGTTASCTVQ